jgi:chemotaxis protein MotB
MKAISTPGIVCIATMLFFSSCVSRKKYEATVAGWEKNYNALYKEYGKVKGANSELANLSMEDQQKLKDQEVALIEEQRKLKELQSVMDAQRNAISNLKQEVCSALKCFTPDELTVEVREGKLYVSMSDKLLFPSGSDAVNARGKEAITMLSTVLKNSELEIMVEGHTDNVPIAGERNRDNWDLSVHRATSVTRMFLENGIPSSRIIASGRAEYHPLKPNDSAEGRSQNRRTEIVLAPRLDKLWKLTEAETDQTVSAVDSK